MQSPAFCTVAVPYDFSVSKHLFNSCGDVLYLCVTLQIGLPYITIIRCNNQIWTYNVDDWKRRKERIYISATHNVNKKICLRSTTLCVTNGASTQTPHRFWYDRQSVESMVNWCRIDSINFPGMGLVKQWAEDAAHPGRLNGILLEMRLRSRTTTLCVILFCKLPKIISN